MSRILAIASVVLAAFAFSLPQASSQFNQPAPATFRGTYDRPVTLTCPLGITSVLVECWGNGGLCIGNSTYPTGGGGGGAYAAATVTVVPGRQYTISQFVDYVQFEESGGVDDPALKGIPIPRQGVLVKAESGKQCLAHNPLGAKGGQAANSIGAVKFSGGDGGPTFGNFGLNGIIIGAYNGGGGGGGATPAGNGINGSAATVTLPGAGGGNGGAGGIQGFNSGSGGNATLLISGGGGGGTGQSSQGGKGLCKIT